MQPFHEGEFALSRNVHSWSWLRGTGPDELRRSKTFLPEVGGLRGVGRAHSRKQQVKEFGSPDPCFILNRCRSVIHRLQAEFLMSRTNGEGVLLGRCGLVWQMEIEKEFSVFVGFNLLRFACSEMIFQSAKVLGILFLPLLTARQILSNFFRIFRISFYSR